MNLGNRKVDAAAAANGVWLGMFGSETAKILVRSNDADAVGEKKRELTILAYGEEFPPTRDDVIEDWIDAKIVTDTLVMRGQGFVDDFGKEVVDVRAYLEEIMFRTPQGDGVYRAPKLMSTPDGKIYDPDAKNVKNEIVRLSREAGQQRLDAEKNASLPGSDGDGAKTSEQLTGKGSSATKPPTGATGSDASTTTETTPAD